MNEYIYVYIYIYTHTHTHRLTTGWTVRESNPGGGRNFPSVQTGPGAHPASCTIGTVSFPGVKCGRGVLLTTDPLLAPRSWKSRAIPLPPLGHNRACNGVTLLLPLYIYIYIYIYIHTHTHTHTHTRDTQNLMPHVSAPPYTVHRTKHIRQKTIRVKC